MKNLTFSKISMSMAVFALLAVFGLAGCGIFWGGSSTNDNTSGNNSNHTNTTSGTTSLATGVSTLDSSTASQIATTDNSSVTFNGTPAATQTLKPGDIFIVQDTARKVESIAEVNGQTVIKTVEPELHEVVNTIDISGDVLLGEEHIDKASVPSKVQVSVKKAKSMSAIDIGGSGTGTGNTFTYTFANYVIDGDGNQSTTYDQVFLNGDIVLDAPKIIFLLKYGIISDKYAEIKFKAGEKLSLSLSSQELTFDKKLSIPLGSLIIPIAVTGGTVNVTVSLNLVFEANGKAKISASFTQDIVIDAGMTATLGPANITSFNNSSYGWDFKQPQIEGEINTSAAVNPDVDLKFLQYTLAGINNSLAVKAKAKANLALTNACYRVSADANVSSIAFVMLPKAAFDIDFSWSGVSGGLDLSMEKYPKELFTYTKGLYDSGDICAVANAAPIANAGADKASNVKASVFLDGTGSYDSDGSIVSYSWTQTSGPTVALTNAYTATPSFTAPTYADTLSFRLTVTDNKGTTATDDVNLSVLSGSTNKMPTANAGSDQTVTANTLVTLSGADSYDSDGSIVSYVWTQTGGTNVSLTGGSIATPSFTAPSSDATLTFKLTVTDNKGASASDYLEVFVRGATPYVLASGLYMATSIAVDSTDVYWIESYSVNKVSKNGGAVTTLASGNPGQFALVAVDFSNVYWTDSGSIMKVSKNGGTPTTLAAGFGEIKGFAVDSTNVYWTEYNSSGAIKKVSVNGGTVTTLASGLTYPGRIAVDAVSVYWTDGYFTSGAGAVKKVNVNGGTPTTLVLGLTAPVGITVDSMNVYWTEVPSPTGCTVKKVNINGGTTTTLASGLPKALDITVDSTNLYWTGSYGVKKVGINGGTVTPLTSTSSNVLAIDSSNVYWLEPTAVMKIAK